MTNRYEVTSINADLVRKSASVTFRKKRSLVKGTNVSVSDIDLTAIGDLPISALDDAVVKLAVQELAEAGSLEYAVPEATKQES